MATYRLTAFDSAGNKLIDEPIQANSDQEAKIKGEHILKEKELLEKTHRLTSSLGNLILFHS